MTAFFFKYFVYYPVVLSRREYVPYYLSQLKQSEWNDLEKLKQDQLKKLKDLLLYAKKNVPYYQESLNLSRLGGIQDLKFLAEIPIIDKTTLRTRSNDLVSKERFFGTTKKTTGGSTGQSVSIWKTPTAMGQELAAAWRGYAWAGIDIGDKQGRFWGIAFSLRDKLRGNLIDFLTHRKRCSAFSFDDASMEEYTSTLNTFEPRHLYGYVSMLTQYAEFLKERSMKLSFPLHCIVTTAEVLTEYSRNLLESIFSCPVYNEYGCGELGTIAHQCEKGRMHVNSENLILEILEGDRPCKPGVLGEIVVTELNNRAMPLIRYRLGDYASLCENTCPCGRNLPVLENIAGRAYDLIYNKAGKMYHGEFFMYIFEEIKKKNLGVTAFQVIQRDYDKLCIKIKPGQGYGQASEDLITERIHDLFCNETAVEFDIVDEIKREASGKMRLVVGMKEHTTH